MRIAIAKSYHETNWFGHVIVTPQVLAEGTFEGNTLLETAAGVRTYIGGIIDEAAAQDVELVPAIGFHLLPSGRITKEAFEIARDGIVRQLCAVHARQLVDAIVLASYYPLGAPQWEISSE